MFGSWFTYNYMPHIWHNINAPSQPHSQWLGNFVLRCIIGYTTTFLARAAVKFLGMKFFLWAYSNPADPLKPHRHYRPGVDLAQQYYVEVPMKLCTYSSVGLACVVLAPLVSRAFGLL